MALDRNLFLDHLASPVPLSRRDGESAAGCSIVPAASIPALAAAGWGDIAFVVLAGGENRLADAFDESWSDANRYALLEGHGVLVVSPCRMERRGIVLAGGSYSHVTLEVEDGQPTVCKRLTLAGQMTHDRELRQLQEVEWLASLPPAAAELFAPVLRTTRSPTLLELRTGFVPGYTLAERVFQRRLDAPRLAALLRHVYTTVSSVLWSRSPLSAPRGQRENYVRRIRRRIETILASDYPADGVVRALLRAGSVTVNGRPCLGPERLLETLERDRRWQPVVDPAGRTLCHGDLILEDVVVSDSAPHGFQLVDPNPANEHPLYDLGKTMMSLWLGYEPIYFDRFAIDWSASADGRLEVDVEIDEEVRAVYLEAAEDFVPFVGQELAHHHQLPREGLRGYLRMSAAIHMLAITVFHLLHHGRERRALAFAATALLHAQAAIDAEPS